MERNLTAKLRAKKASQNEAFLMGRRLRALGILAALALLLGGCAGQTKAEVRAEALTKQYAALGGCTARLGVTVKREDEALRYLLDAEREEGETRLTVLEPEELSGVTAVVSGEALSLRYDGLVLDAGSVDERVSAVNAFDLFLRAAGEGWVREQSEEPFNGQSALRLCFQTTDPGGGTLLVTAYFDDANAPLYAEIEREGEVLAFLEFTDFRFGAILEEPREKSADTKE